MIQADNKPQGGGPYRTRRLRLGLPRSPALPKFDKMASGVKISGTATGHGGIRNKLPAMEICIDPGSR